MFLLLQDHVQEIVASMAHAIQMVPVSVTVALLALIAPLVLFPVLLSMLSSKFICYD